MMEDDRQPKPAEKVTDSALQNAWSSLKDKYNAFFSPENRQTTDRKSELEIAYEALTESTKKQNDELEQMCEGLQTSQYDLRAEINRLQALLEKKPLENQLVSTESQSNDALTALLEKIHSYPGLHDEHCTPDAIYRLIAERESHHTEVKIAMRHYLQEANTERLIAANSHGETSTIASKY
jgi:predicted RNase H-like nuclease (RuvC/YqgF family)